MTTLTVPTGDLGLDLVLGGGWRLVPRLRNEPECRSATVLVRGGPGAGKSLLALHGALALAEALHGDVAVACVELLPTEYLAQARSARNDLCGRLSILGEPIDRDPPGPAVVSALLTDLNPESPDLVGSLENLAADLEMSGCRPACLIVDSLAEGYSIGSSASRASVDAVMKLAAQRGIAIVLCEEVQATSTTSAWTFAADTVVELGVDDRGRWLQIRKHRFGPTVPGRHRFDLDAGRPPAAILEPGAWATARTTGVLERHGWRSDTTERRTRVPQLVWSPGFAPTSNTSISGDLVLIRSDDPGLAASLAHALVPESPASAQDLLVRLDPVTLRGRQQTHQEHDYTFVSVPVARGAARALHQLSESGPRLHAYRRIVIGDLGVPLSGELAGDWIDMLCTFAALVADTGACVPVIAYAATEAGSAPIVRLANNADGVIDARLTMQRDTIATIALRARRETQLVTWGGDVRTRPLVPSSLDDLPGRRLGATVIRAAPFERGSDPADDR